MSMIDLLWNIHQQQQLIENKHDTFEAKTKAQDAASRVADLEHAVDRLTLLSRSLWELLRAQHALTDQQLLDKVREIDMRDGHMDGKLTTTDLHKCPRCGNVLNPKRAKCIFCGAANQSLNPF